MPSSLTRVLSSALVFSTHPPESVWGTVTSASIQSQLFLEAWDESLQSYGHDITSQPIVPRFYPTKRPTCLNQDNHRLADLPFSVPAIAPQRWYGNIDPFPIGFAFRLYLRGRLTLPGLSLDRNPWVFGEEDFHLLYRYSCQHSHFHTLHRPSRDCFTAYGTLPYHFRRSLSLR